MILNIVKFVISWLFCAFYSSWVALGIVIAFIFKRNTKFWIPKSRPTPPECLTSNEFGEHKFVKINGINIHYVAKGDPKNPLMLFVHGFPEFWFSWRFQIKEFSKDYYTVALDQRGYGQSDKPKSMSDYQLNNMVDDIYKLAKHLGQDKFTLVCHDWGSVIGFRYVMKHMDTLEKYVMIGAPPSEVFFKLVFSTITQFLKSWYVFFFKCPYLPEFSVRMFDMKLFKVMELKSKEEVEAFKYTFGQEGAFTGPINYYRQNTQFLVEEPKLQKPKHFVPGLYLLGEKEKYISFESGKETVKLYDNLEYKLIAGANHFAQQHKPETTNRMLREFLSKK